MIQNATPPHEATKNAASHNKDVNEFVQDRGKQPVGEQHSGAQIIITAFSQSPANRKNTGPVAFNRLELNDILRVYGQLVAAGEWRDYAIDHMDNRAVFSIFRRSSEVPLFRVEKNPKLANRQGAYSVIAASGMILKRGHELRQVLRVFDKALGKLSAVK